jgi:hypothetical protein
MRFSRRRWIEHLGAWRRENADTPFPTAISTAMEREGSAFCRYCSAFQVALSIRPFGVAASPARTARRVGEMKKSSSSTILSLRPILLLCRGVARLGGRRCPRGLARLGRTACQVLRRLRSDLLLWFLLHFRPMTSLGDTNCWSRCCNKGIPWLPALRTNLLSAAGNCKELPTLRTVLWRFS